MRYNIKNLMVFLFFCIFLSTKNVLASGSSEFKTYSTLGNSKAMGMNASIKFPASWKSKHVSPISSIVLHYGDDASSSCSLSIKQSSVDANAKLPYLSKSDFPSFGTKFNLPSENVPAPPYPAIILHGLQFTHGILFLFIGQTLFLANLP